MFRPLIALSLSISLFCSQAMGDNHRLGFFTRTAIHKHLKQHAKEGNDDFVNDRKRLNKLEPYFEDAWLQINKHPRILLHEFDIPELILFLKSSVYIARQNETIQKRVFGEPLSLKLNTISSTLEKLVVWHDQTLEKVIPQTHRISEQELIAFFHRENQILFLCDFISLAINWAKEFTSIDLSSQFRAQLEEMKHLRQSCELRIQLIAKKYFSFDIAVLSFLTELINSPTGSFAQGGQHFAIGLLLNSQITESTKSLDKLLKEKLTQSLGAIK